MTPTPIYQDHTGQWRPLNKEQKYDSCGCLTIAWEQFEQSITYHPFPNCPEVKPGEVVMAQLQWQYYGHKVGGAGPFWLCIEDDEYKLYRSYEHFKSFYENNKWGKTETRQIWVAVTDSAKEEEPNLSLKASMKFERLMNSIPKNTDKGESILLGHFHYDHEKQTEIFIPIEKQSPSDTKVEVSAEELAEEKFINMVREENALQLEAGIPIEELYDGGKLHFFKEGAKFGYTLKVSSLQSIIEDKEKEVAELRALLLEVRRSINLDESPILCSNINNALNKKA